MEPANPYAAPVSAPNPHPPELFGFGGVVIAGIAGMLLGGAVLLAMNFNAMGQRVAAVFSLAVAVAVFKGLGSAATALPLSPEAAGFAVAALGLVVLLAAMWRWQGNAIAKARASGRRLRPWWLALGIGLSVAFALLILPALFTALKDNVN